MSILIKGMEMPKSCSVCRLFGEYGCPFIGAVGYALTRGERNEDCPLVTVPEHGRLVDADKLHDAMYHRAFETDGDTMWQSGCWVRYRAIEQTMDAAPTVIPKEE